MVPDFVGADEVVSPSAVKDLLTGTRPRQMSVAEIQRIVADFAEAAQALPAGRLRRGADAFGQRLSAEPVHHPHTNRRNDEYGGTLEKRTRFGREEKARAIRARVGADFPVIMKMNGSDWLAAARRPQDPGAGRGGLHHGKGGRGRGGDLGRPLRERLSDGAGVRLVAACGT